MSGRGLFTARPVGPAVTDRRWKFELDDDRLGEEPPEPDPIEPGRPSLENALFVLLGAACTLAVFLHLAGLFR